jgi:hypothetical protein
LRRLTFLCALAGCASTITDDPLSPDARPGPPDAPPAVDPGIAPVGIVAGEEPLLDGDQTIVLAPSISSIFRIDVLPEEHAAVSLLFADIDGVTLAADRWDGEAPIPLGETDAGAGKRFLTVFDPDGGRTYWFRAYSPVTLTATLRLVRTPFVDGLRCAADCAHLLQLPLPTDPAVDGYDIDGGTVFRYWFGRRDLVMFVRHAARRRALAGKAPFFPYDFSQWDAMTPGVDVGAPRHVSHQRGKDVDISIYGTDGNAYWRSYCTVEHTGDGRECLAGTVTGFDAYESAREVSGFFESGRVTMTFLDRELIGKVTPAAARAASDGLIDPSLVALYGDGQHLQHWPNHDNHIHVRVSETDYALRMEDVPFEAP